MKKVKLSEVVGGGYNQAWNYRGRYLVIKGGRGSKKSKTIALRWIFLMMKYSTANLLVIRKVFNTHRDSTFADLKWATHRLGVNHLWKFTTSPLQAEYIPTGQKVLFRGLDNPLSITSITVEKGYLSWCWFEEAYQITNEDEFDKVDMSIRGDTKGLFKQIVITFNPWNERHFLKRRFFDIQDSDVLVMTTTYECNEFLDEADIKLFDWMKQHKPKRYKVEGLGHWGIAEGVIFDDWLELDFDPHEIAKRRGVKSIFGIDFGYTNDPSAFVAALVDEKKKELYLFDEHYEKAMLNDEIASMIQRKGYGKEIIIADSAEPKSIAELKRLGVHRIRAAEKGRDSIKTGIQLIQQYKMYVHPTCTNMMMELDNYTWKIDKTGMLLNEPADEFNHLIDALRYAMEQVRVKREIKPVRRL